MNWCRCYGSLCTVAWRDTKDTNYAVRLAREFHYASSGWTAGHGEAGRQHQHPEPIVERYQKRLMRLLFRADAPLPAGGIRMSSYLLIAR
jgi:hypothetical protein